jgi:hypothetical protein
MRRTDIINQLISYCKYKTYLEIGVSKPEDNFDLIKCKFKIGVDPNGKASYTGTSDEFFSENKLTYDIIFIDGLHEEPQVTKDIYNSLAVLNSNGTIVLHDCLPLAEEHQTEHYNGSVWAGTVWRSNAKLRMTRSDLELDIVYTDWGCGILRRGKSELYPVDPDTVLDYNFYVNNASKMFNIISAEDFLKKYCPAF